MATLQNINRYGLLLLCTLTVFTKRSPCVFHLQRLKSLLTFGTTLVVITYEKKSVDIHEPASISCATAGLTPSPYSPILQPRQPGPIYEISHDHVTMRFILGLS